VTARLEVQNDQLADLDSRVCIHPDPDARTIIQRRRAQHPTALAPPSSHECCPDESRMVPTLTLGISGSATTAVMLGGLMMWGLRRAAALREEPGLRVGPDRVSTSRTCCC
jgi:hypothetical protein